VRDCSAQGGVRYRFAPMNLRALLVVSLCGCGPLEAAVAAADDELAEAPARLEAPATFRLGNWNIEWLGSERGGPSDEALQQANAHEVLAQAGADVWGLSEIVTVEALGRVTPSGYRTLLATEVPGGTQWYSAPEQKLALAWREGAAEVREAELILTEQAYAFGGRPPLRVKLELVGFGELTVIVVHLKAMFDADSVARRQASMRALEAYLAALGDAPFAVIGDFNDAAAAFTTAQTFVTAGLPASTVTGSRTIDHQLVSASFAERWVKTTLLKPEMPRYGETTSDHYPVVSEWRRPVRIAEVLANEPGIDRKLERVTLSGDGDLSGWTLSDATQVRHAFAAGTRLSGTLSVSGEEASTGALSLNNPGDAVVLRDARGRLVDSVSWTRPQEDGVPLERR